jgi:predicted phosphodiesterase
LNFLSHQVGVIGDVHTENVLLEKVIAFLQPLPILCVGDIVDGSGNPEACCALLSAAQVFTVRGNHDNWLLRNVMREFPDATQRDSISPHSLEYLHSLPDVLEFDTSLGKLLLCHGLGRNDMGRVFPYDDGYAIESNGSLQELVQSRHYRLVINGHTHYRMVRRFDSLTLINAGTLCRNHQPGFLMVDFEKGEVQTYDVSGATFEIRQGERFTINPRG